jgi:hypothetical protein
VHAEDEVARRPLARGEVDDLPRRLQLGRGDCAWGAKRATDVRAAWLWLEEGPAALRGRGARAGRCSCPAPTGRRVRRRCRSCSAVSPCRQRSRCRAGSSLNHGPGKAPPLPRSTHWSMAGAGGPAPAARRPPPPQPRPASAPSAPRRCGSPAGRRARGPSRRRT